MPNRKRKKHQASKNTTRAKGDIVEQVVASMHDVPGVTVDRNVFLPVQDGSKRTSEIDVLLTSQVAGYIVRVAIECKNEKAPIGVDEVNEFIGKLNDVGIPTQQGIVISASGYASGAAVRAQGVGIKPLFLKDITTELSDLVREAFQSVVYLLLTITNIQVSNDVGEQAFAGDILFFRDKDGNVCGSVAGLVWQKWLSGEISETLGTYQINLTLPDGWLQIVNGRSVTVLAIRADVQVTGHVISVIGAIRRFSLVDAITNKPQREHLEENFEFPSATYPVTAFSVEDELQKFIHRAKGINVSVGRFRVPRIRWGAIYWPPSDTAVQRIAALMQAFEQGKIPDPRPFKFADIEGTDMAEAWRPVWHERSQPKGYSTKNTD